MDVIPTDLLKSASTCRAALEPVVALDWAVQAGDLSWDVRKTVIHVIDAVGWYAAHLAMQSPRRLRFDFRAHDDASNTELLDVLEAAAATLAQVVTAAPPGARAFHTAGMADRSGFLAMGCDEILVHGWDVVRGLGGEFVPSADIAERVLRRLFPWVRVDASPWQALLWANGRVDLPGRPHTGPDWVWHCAPLDEWDGTVPHLTTEPTPG
jgi:hypothetical protein